MLGFRALWRTQVRKVSIRSLNEKCTDFFATRTGRRVKIGLLAGTVVLYPVTSIIVNGPLNNVLFTRRFNCDELPNWIAKIFAEEYNRFLDLNARKEDDAIVEFHALKDLEFQDSVASGSLGVRTGLHVGLPFNCTFKTVDEALAYFKTEHPKGLHLFGEDVAIDWTSELGRAFAETFVLSESAWRFAVLRDLNAHDGYSALAGQPLTWATFTSFSGIFTYWMHRVVPFYKGSALSFFTFYGLFTLGAYYGARHWHLLYRYISDVHADGVAALTSPQHSAGGREFYYKWLKRNRILRQLHEPLYLKIKPSGDIRGVTTQIIARYDHLKEVNQEDDELHDVLHGDC